MNALIVVLLIVVTARSLHVWFRGGSEAYARNVLVTRYAENFAGLFIGFEVGSLIVGANYIGELHPHIYWAAALPIVVGVSKRYRHQQAHPASD